MEEQIQTLGCFNQEALRDPTWFHDLDWPYGLWPTRDHSPSHWGSNPRKIMVSHCICVPLLLLMICSPHDVNLGWGNPPSQGILQSPDSQPQGQVLRLQGIQRKILGYPVQGGSPDLWTTDKLLQVGISPPKLNCWAQDQVIDPRWPEPSPTHHQNLARGCK